MPSNRKTEERVQYLLLQNENNSIPSKSTPLYPNTSSAIRLAVNQAPNSATIRLLPPLGATTAQQGSPVTTGSCRHRCLIQQQQSVSQSVALFSLSISVSICLVFSFVFPPQHRFMSFIAQCSLFPIFLYVHRVNKRAVAFLLVPDLYNTRSHPAIMNTRRRGKRKKL